MNKVLEINPEQGWVRVETGLVKDQLNDALRPYGYFFSPDLSTSNRATIGGMINTDASGAGSLVYGKTSDHVLALSSVLIDGSVLNTKPIDKEEAITGRRLFSEIANDSLTKRQLILERFPNLNRFLTGYDLKHLWNDELTQFDLTRILTGSEGTCRSLLKLNSTLLQFLKSAY